MANDCVLKHPESGANNIRGEKRPSVGRYGVNVLSHTVTSGSCLGPGPPPPSALAAEPPPNGLTRVLNDEVVS